MLVKTWPLCLNNLGYLRAVISPFPAEQVVSLRHEALGMAAI